MPLRRGTANQHSHHQLMRRRLRSGRAGISPPTFFFPGLVRPIPTGEAGRGRREKQQHDGVAQRPRSHHRAQGTSVNPFGGHPPLSDHRPPLTGIRERGITPSISQKRSPKSCRDDPGTTRNNFYKMPRPSQINFGVRKSFARKVTKKSPKSHRNELKMTLE